MSGGSGTLELIAHFVGESLQPLAEQMAPANFVNFMRQMGIDVPDDILSDAQVNQAATSIVANATALQTELPNLLAALQAIDPDDLATIPPVVSVGATITTTIISTIDDIQVVFPAIRSALTGLTAAEQTLANEFLSELPGRLIEFLIIENIERRSPTLAEMLPLFGLLDDVQESGDSTGVILPYRRRRLHLKRFAQAITDPQTYLRETFRFGENDFTGLELFRPIEKMLKDNGLPAVLIEEPGEQPVLEAFLLRLQAEDTVSPPALAAELRLPGQQNFSDSTPIGGVWSVNSSATVNFETGMGILLSPSGALDLIPPSGSIELEASTGLAAASGGPDPMTIFGLAGSTRLTLESFEAKAGLVAAWDSASGQATAEPTISVSMENLRAEISLAGGDSFLNDVSGGGAGGANISLGAMWSPSTGLRLEGSSALEVSIPTHASIGPATLENVYLISSFDTEGDTDEIPVEISAAVKGNLGPLSASVDRVGIKLTFSFPEDGGNIGPMQLDASFKPPNGIGLSIDGGAVKGGGYLYLDPEKGEYAGALELKFQGVIHLKAIGILNTILPDGSDGFSLVILVSAEFTPIQLGYGFTLNGVGGLIGINRTMMLDVLSDGVRDGSIQSILFPDDVVANAVSIISDLQTAFPPMNGRFIVGPMAKLGWGTPTLVSLEIGVLLEIPRPAFAILGILSVALPDEAVPIVEINVAFVGSVDFERKELKFDASLFDSSILTFTLTGDMALRVYWGDNANFLLTVGGFHPSFTPPPMDLPDLRRLGINILTGNPRLTAESYFAVTSNTVQFGGRIDAYAGSGIFSIQGHLSLDALIQFNPFYFIVDISAMVAAKSGNTTLFSVRLELTLEGPTPWRATGRATFSISLLIVDIDVSIGFSVTFGEERETTLPPIRVLDEIIEALNKVENWQANTLEGNSLLVSQRDIGDAAQFVIHPLGSLTVDQKVVPLNTAIERFGSRNLSGGNVITLSDFTVGSQQQMTNVVRDDFAPAQFYDLSNAEKLSRPSFESFDSGLTSASSTAPKAIFQRSVAIEHELTYIEKPELPKRNKLIFTLDDLLISAFLQDSAVAKSKLAKGVKVPTGLGTPKINLGNGGFAIADIDTLELTSGTTVFRNETEAMAALDVMQENEPSLAGRLQVVPEFEVAA